jgi:hypothetical protein
MNQLIDNDPARQPIRDFSGRLGALAAHYATTSNRSPSQWSAIVQAIRQNRKEDIEHKIKATHFILGD